MNGNQGVRAAWFSVLRRIWLQPRVPESKIAKEFALILLETLEQRRSQLIGRATVLTAGDTAIVLAYLQFVLVGKQLSVSVMIGSIGLALASLGFYQGLRTISGVSRRDGARSGGRLRNHLLNYQVVAASSPHELAQRLGALDDDAFIGELAEQAVSLSRLLIRRYDALKQSFWLSVWAIALLAFAIGMNYLDALVALGYELSTNLPAMSPSQTP